jgi:hypothetical protein
MGLALMSIVISSLVRLVKEDEGEDGAWIVRFGGCRRFFGVGGCYIRIDSELR